MIVHYIVCFRKFEIKNKKDYITGLILMFVIDNSKPRRSQIIHLVASVGPMKGDMSVEC